MKLLLNILISFSYLNSLQAQRTCANCATSTTAKRLCAKNGQLYSDLFCAVCADPQSNYELFTCATNVSQGDCASQCTAEQRLTACRVACQSVSTGNFQCSSTGRVYSNACRERCLGGASGDLFNCRQFNFSNGRCNLKCFGLVACRAQNEGKTLRPICGRDGLLYRSLDELRCAGERFVILTSTGEPSYEGTADCKAYVELIYGAVVGDNLAPGYYKS